MPTDLEVREALADTLTPVIRSHATVPGQINPPCLVVIESDITFDATMGRGSERYLLLCRLLAGGEFTTAQKTLLDVIYRIRDRLWDHPDLGGAVADCRLARKRGDTEGEITVGQATFAIVDIEVEAVT